MLTVAQAFETFMNSLRLHDGEARDATRQEQYVFNAMRRQLRPTESFISGSYGRNTAIRPLHDIDLFLVLADDGRNPPEPEDALARVQWALRAEFHDKETRLQNRSVNINFTGTEIGFDVVPALYDPWEQGGYLIPDRRAGQWIRSNPRKHQEACDDANDVAKKKLKPWIKAIKRWNFRHDKPVPSFLLEVLACRGVTHSLGDKSYAEGLAQLFDYMCANILNQCPVPGSSGPTITSWIPQGRLVQAHQRLTQAVRVSKRALELEYSGYTVEALDLWRELLGTDFPVR
ncbi:MULTISPECIES: nucleotidyltransferase domain-containing protein [Myxococcus]|nr:MULTISPECIES: nucleotidyltransferase [Myxococcus]NOJ51741.1 nucleotidyltransferase [Myxococcus xanthus]QPM79541.1 nucleotidyltransferase [Myxococcus xanthus]QVW68621.1 nucleotidyltransferase [Myxococcus xanthus DZ2]QZZ54892.1 hypothetical protein MyxoNM_37625 [Myxococcus xanthus]UEO05266.1 nucleotidyltransferase [Myxococcus xanthus DZ2]